MKRLLPLFLILPLLLLAACRNEPAPLTQERLDAINCQIGDLPRKQTYNAVEGREPALGIFLGKDPAMISTLAWNDISSSRQTFSCTIFVFADYQLAQNGFQRACDELTPPFRFPNYGELACRAGDQEVNVIFQKDIFLVWIWADYKGLGIEKVAQNIDSRLQDEIR